MLAVACIGLCAGILIGCVGVGGVIIVPALVYGLGVPIRDAIGSAMLGYIFTGIIGTIVYARKGSIHWPVACWLCVGATPGVLAGAWGTSVISPMFLQAGVGLLLIASSLNSLLQRRASVVVRETLPPRTLVAIGAITGFVSALTGTGGPLVVVPVLMSLCLPTLAVVGLSQAVQIPIATVGTLGNIMFSHPSLWLGAVLGFTLALGSLIGAKLAHEISRDRLSRFASVVLLCVGAAIMLRIAL